MGMGFGGEVPRSLSQRGQVEASGIREVGAVEVWDVSETGKELYLFVSILMLIKLQRFSFYLVLRAISKCYNVSVILSVCWSFQIERMDSLC